MNTSKARSSLAADGADAVAGDLTPLGRDVAVVVGSSVAARITVEFAVVEDVVAVAVAGEVDMLTARAFSATLDELLGNAGASVVVDLTGVSFLGTAGLKAIADFHRAAQAAGVHWTLAGSRAVTRLLRLVGVDVPVCASRQDAFSQAGGHLVRG